MNGILKKAVVWGLIAVSYIACSSGGSNGGSPPAPAKVYFAYVVNSSSNNVSAYTIDSTGALTSMAGSPFAAGYQPTSVAVDPTGKFAYVVNSLAPSTISAYTINSSTGALTEIPGSPFALDSSSPNCVAVDPTGKFVYVAAASLCISAYMIDSTTGALTEVAGSPFVASEASMQGPFSVAFDPTGKFAYAVVRSTYGSVFAYAIDSATGALTELTGSPFGTGGGSPNLPMGSTTLAVDPIGKFVYVPNSFYANVSGYAIDSITGALTEITGSPFGTGYSPGSIVVDPTGKFVYVVNGTPGNVAGYTINSVTGALTEITGSPFAAGTNPGFMLVDPAGKFLYVAGQGIYAYAINSTTGALTEVAGSPFATGTGPISIAIVPIK